MLNFNVKHHLLLNVKQLFVLLMAGQTREEPRSRENFKKAQNPTMHVMT